VEVRPITWSNCYATQASMMRPRHWPQSTTCATILTTVLMTTVLMTTRALRVPVLVVEGHRRETVLPHCLEE
jgi:hypothetical protein